VEKAETERVERVYLSKPCQIGFEIVLEVVDEREDDSLIRLSISKFEHLFEQCCLAGTRARNDELLPGG